MPEQTGTPLTVWTLLATTVLGALGWITTALRDRRTADSALVTASSELVDRLMAEIERLGHQVDDLRVQVTECERKHAETASLLAHVVTPR